MTPWYNEHLEDFLPTTEYIAKLKGAYDPNAVGQEIICHMLNVFLHPLATQAIRVSDIEHAICGDDKTKETLRLRMREVLKRWSFVTARFRHPVMQFAPAAIQLSIAVSRRSFYKFLEDIEFKWPVNSVKAMPGPEELEELRLAFNRRKAPKGD
jgi:hypothetical protein